MKKILLILLFFNGFLSIGQRFDWVSSAGYAGVANSYNGAIATARDSQGNLYTLDAANATQQCQGISAMPFTTGTNIFLYKFNATGEIVYIKPIGTNFKPLNLVVGENDNLYVLGSLIGTGQIQVNTKIFTDTENRNYIFKFNPAGNLIWRAKNNFSFGNFTECSLLLFANNHIYFQSGGLSISKLNTDGQYITTLTATAFTSSTSSNAVFFRASGVLTNGDLIFVAISRGTITYGSTVLTPTYNQFLHTPILTLRTTQNLAFVWANYIDGLRDPDLDVIPIAIGNDNGIYLGLQISGTVTAGSDIVISEDTSGNTIGAVLKMDANGNRIWVKSTTNNIQTYTILNNPDGNGIFCGGQIFGFQPVTLGATSVNPSNGNAVITKIDYNGIFQNSFSFCSGPIGSYVRSLTTNNAGQFYVGGKLNNGNTTPVFSCISRQSNNGLFLGKFTEQPDRAATPVISANGNTLSATPTFTGNIQWFLNGTAISGANSQNFTATHTGNYTVSFVLNDYTACVSNSAVFNLSVLGKDYFNLNSISILPNPTTGLVSIASTSNLVMDTIEIFDFSGKKISKQSTNTKEIDLSSFESGIYILKLHSGNTTIQKKIIKQ